MFKRVDHPPAPTRCGSRSARSRCRDKFSLVALAGFTTLLVGAAGCGSSGASTANAYPLGTVSVTGFPTSTYLTFWVMQAEHFDSLYGFKLDYVNTTGGGALYTPVASGHVDASTILPPLAIQYAANGQAAPGGPLVPVPAFWVVATPEHPGTAIVARSSITSLADLEGKVIATHDVVSGFFLQAETLLASHGFQINTTSPQSLHTDTMPFSAMGAALSTDQVQAALMDYITALKTVALGQGHILTNVLGAPPYTNYDEDSFVFQRAFIQQHPQAAVGLLRAAMQSNYWILHHEQQAKAMLLSRLGISPASAASWIDGYHLDGFQTDFAKPLAQSTVGLDEQSLLKFGFIKNPVNVNAVYQYADLVQEAQTGWHPA